MLDERIRDAEGGTGTMSDSHSPQTAHQRDVGGFGPNGFGSEGRFHLLANQLDGNDGHGPVNTELGSCGI